MSFAALALPALLARFARCFGVSFAALAFPPLAPNRLDEMALAQIRGAEILGKCEKKHAEQTALPGAALRGQRRHVVMTYLTASANGRVGVSLIFPGCSAGTPCSADFWYHWSIVFVVTFPDVHVVRDLLCAMAARATVGVDLLGWSELLVQEPAVDGVAQRRDGQREFRAHKVSPRLPRAASSSPHVASWAPPVAWK